MNRPQWINTILFGRVQCIIGRHRWWLAAETLPSRDPIQYEVFCARCGKRTQDITVIILKDILNRLMQKL